MSQVVNLFRRVVVVVDFGESTHLRQISPLRCCFVRIFTLIKLLVSQLLDELLDRETLSFAGHAEIDSKTLSLLPQSHEAEEVANARPIALITLHAE